MLEPLAYLVQSVLFKAVQENAIDDPELPLELPQPFMTFPLLLMALYPRRDRLLPCICFFDVLLLKDGVSPGDARTLLYWTG